MMGYTAAEIGIACLGALCYGIAFALGSIAVLIVARELPFILRLPYHVLVYERLASLPSPCDGSHRFGNRLCQIAVAIRCVIFSVGYILVSYIFLDGALRLYMLLLASCIATLTYRLLKSGALMLSDRVILSVFVIPMLILRILTYVPRRIYLHFTVKP